MLICTLLMCHTSPPSYLATCYMCWDQHWEHICSKAVFLNLNHCACLWCATEAMATRSWIFHISWFFRYPHRKISRSTRQRYLGLTSTHTVKSSEISGYHDYTDPVKRIFFSVSTYLSGLKNIQIHGQNIQLRVATSPNSTKTFLDSQISSSV